MIRPPIVESVGDNYVIIEPPAGMLRLMNNRVEELKKLQDRFIMLDYSSIFILACLHTQQVVTGNGEAITTYHSTAVGIASALNIPNSGTLRKIFSDITPEEFASIVNEFQFNYPRDVIDNTFNKIDELCFITKKKVDDEKKD